MDPFAFSSHQPAFPRLIPSSSIAAVIDQPDYSSSQSSSSSTAAVIDLAAVINQPAFPRLIPSSSIAAVIDQPDYSSSQSSSSSIAAVIDLAAVIDQPAFPRLILRTGLNGKHATCHGPGRKGGFYALPRVLLGHARERARGNASTRGLSFVMKLQAPRFLNHGYFMRHHQALWSLVTLIYLLPSSGFLKSWSLSSGWTWSSHSLSSFEVSESRSFHPLSPGSVIFSHAHSFVTKLCGFQITVISSVITKLYGLQSRSFTRYQTLGFLSCRPSHPLLSFEVLNHGHFIRFQVFGFLSRSPLIRYQALRFLNYSHFIRYHQAL
ncbi:uncharacterized protein UV8b_07163 [Ustilaginoidea virens]|uniref:Uncharacterized protein n=1 Tax=Ustilaginoidea virens TaxID=1159556 RepID=A0A8E5MK98_USTVR|nr:uncharacterized protein UV8b_07163 [Ustilaginoidea virens]QUC22922.1 hypothetical protein UV8b_07163 [Ustilaginoidea virens]